MTGCPPLSNDAQQPIGATLALGPEDQRLAVYYGKGQVRDDGLNELASYLADGSLSYSEALDEAVSRYLNDGGDIDLLDAAEERLGKRIADLAMRIQEGLENAPVAVIRPDLHPIVTAGLGIEGADELLSKEQINSLLAGRRTDGDPIEGKHYAATRRLPTNPRTGERNLSQPIGSYDFCPTPDKSVSVAWAFARPVERARIFQAHIDAARESVGGVIAEHVGQARLGKGGEDGFERGHDGDHHAARSVVGEF
jgi:TrwC relaxase